MFLAPIGVALAGAGAATAGAGAAIGAGLAASAPLLTAASIGLTATSLLNSPKLPGSQTFGSLPGAPNPGASLDTAKEDAASRLRMIAASGGTTTYAGNTAIDPSMIQRKTLLGM